MQNYWFVYDEIATFVSKNDIFENKQQTIRYLQFKFDSFLAELAVSQNTQKDKKCNQIDDHR